MMRRLIYILLLTLLCWSGCTTDTVDGTTPVKEGDPVELILNFGAQNIEHTIVTRQTMPEISDEAKIWNLYIYIFDSEGNKLYGRYFDVADVLDSANAVANSDEDAWYVTVPEGDSQDCSGTVKIKTIARSGCKIFGISNIDSKMVSISPEVLSRIQHENELLDMVVSLNQEFVERSGYFPMTGELSPVNTASLSGTLQLCRIDAKVRFWVKVGNSDIESFELKKWQIFNVSGDTYLMNRSVRDKYGLSTADSAQGYFDTPTKNVEEEEVYEAGNATDISDDKIRYGFSFYLLENALQPKKSPTTYSDRERQVKDAAGMNGEWEYANDNSTYVVLTGRLTMRTDYAISDSEVKNGCTLNAEVRYVVHLGDFSHAGPADFSTERNTAYTYTITVNGVNDIRVEVDSSNDETEGITENAPGATGEVTIALQEIFDCDAHYETHVMSFDQKYIKADDVTWYVRTPFSEGKPTVVNGTDVTTGLDFKWVEFRLNEKWSNTYSEKRMLYIPHSTKLDASGNPYPSADGQTMYVDELVKFLREQKRAYDAGEPNAFDRNGKIVITAFVNEFYYDEHPFTSAAGPLLWKRVVNQDNMRLMHILSDTKESLDKESSVVGSSYTIQQRSIQSVYNQNHADLQNAWGMEHFDEYERLSYNAAGTGVVEDRGNGSDYNGRLNTLREWGLVGANNTAFTEGVRWDKYLNLTATNSESVLRDGTKNDANYKYLQYSCMSRNRDNNGNGTIEPGEVRWYMASIKQLIGIWMGADGIDNTARLYKRSASEKDSDDETQWRQHVVSSTRNGSNSNSPYVVWAEEGSSIGDLQGSTDWGRMTKWEVRCVRNLGMDDSDDADLEDMATDYVQIRGTDAVPLFDLNYLNEKSIRYLGQEGVDLVYSDELSAQNRLYWQFEATSLNCPSYAAITFPEMQANIDRSLGNNPYCPT
ncbi:MAG: DUF4906 domain-containing protein, partial [Alistipes sp.]|nr:DUF4906 domain-containing protein [Alistipes sp.]